MARSKGPLRSSAATGCKAAANSNGPRGSPLLDPCRRAKGSGAKLQSSAPTITPFHPSSQSRKLGASGAEHLLAGHCVESVLEVQLDQHIVDSPCMALMPRTNAVNSCFRAGRHSHPDLCWEESSSSILPHKLHQALARQPPQNLPNSNGADATLWLGDGNQVGTSQKRSSITASAARRQQRHHTSQPHQEAISSTWPTSLPEVLHPKARRTRGRGRRKVLQCLGHRISSGLGGSSCNGGATGSGWTGCKARRAATVAAVSRAKPSARSAAQALPSKPSRAKLVARSFLSGVVRERCFEEVRPRLSQSRMRSPSSQRRSRSKVPRCRRRLP